MNHGSLKKAMSRFRRFVAYSLIACFLICLPAPGFSLMADELSKAAESDLKAVYIFNFIRFTDWPENQKKQMQGRIRLNVLGDFAVHDVIKGISKKQAGRQMGLEVQACSTPSCLEESSILFIGRSGHDRFGQLLESVKNRPVLTISDIPGFASSGGMIEIRQHEKRLGFIINVNAIKKSNLYISAQLLQLADIYEGDQ